MDRRRSVYATMGGGYLEGRIANDVTALPFASVRELKQAHGYVICY